MHSESESMRSILAKLRTLAAIAFLAALICLAAAAGLQRISRPRVPEPLILLTFETHGSAYERGHAHGRRLRAPIAEIIDSLPESIRTLDRTSTALSQAVENVSQLPEGNEILDEIRGIADGAQQPRHLLIAFNLCLKQAEEQSGCSTAVVTSSPDGPLLINTTDAPSQRSTRARTRYLVVQTAYPKKGNPYLILHYAGSVAALRGINQAGLAIGASSGGPGRNRLNPEGLEPHIVSRYALQFCTATSETIELFTQWPSSYKARNKSIIDRSGHAAIAEVSSRGVQTRRCSAPRCLYASNNFLEAGHLPISESVPSSAYGRNAQARVGRMEQLLVQYGTAGIAGAIQIVRDTNDGQPGQICQRNSVMFTRHASIWNCQSASLLLLPGHPAETEPIEFRFAASGMVR